MPQGSSAPGNAPFIAITFRIAAQANLNHIIRLGKFPRIAEKKPIVGALHLPAIFKGLFEDAIFIANAITNAGDIERGQRIEETGGQPSQAAIA